MPITLNRFKCANGHSFEANAKLRTRCPDCGVSTKRSFSTEPRIPKPIKDESEPTPDSTEEPEVDDDSPEPIKGPVLIRQGRPRMAVAKKTPAKEPVKKKPNFKPVGSKVSAGLVKSHIIKKRGVMPTIKGKPVKTAVARGIQGHEQKPRFVDEVIRKYGF